jgi:putative FmdB family regulatory protein
MPTYGYRCSSCGHQFEIQQRMTDAPLEACPKCQGKLAKILYPTGVIFKGSGFYSTDYKASGKSESSNGSSPSPETKSDSKTDAKSDAKSDAKPDAKTESKTDSAD